MLVDPLVGKGRVRFIVRRRLLVLKLRHDPRQVV